MANPVLIQTSYTQTILPVVPDVWVATVPAGTYNGAIANGTSFTLPGAYGPGDYITGVTPVSGTTYSSFDCTVELRNASTTVGTLYQKLGTASWFPGASLGVPLTTSAWLHVSATTAGTFTASGSDARMIVSFVHEL